MNLFIGIIYNEYPSKLRYSAVIKIKKINIMKKDKVKYI